MLENLIPNAPLLNPTFAKKRTTVDFGKTRYRILFAHRFKKSGFGVGVKSFNAVLSDAPFV